MSSFMSQNDFPRFSQVDHAAEAAAAAAEAYERAVRAHRNQEAITDYFLDLIGTTLMDSHNALADMRQLLSVAPLQDGYDLQQWARIGQPSDASLAHLVRKLYGQAHLAEPVWRLRHREYDGGQQRGLHRLLAARAQER